MHESAFKHGSDPPATGFLKSALSGSLNYCLKGGVVERPLKFQEGTQRNLLVLQGLFQSVQSGKELFL